MLNNSSLITSKGQITIPSKLRKKFNLEGGKRVLFIETSDGILIKPVLSEMRMLRGILKDKIDINRLEEIVEDMRKDWRLDETE
jgi:AbrB family looped-hinge helix DNA binding protein